MHDWFDIIILMLSIINAFFWPAEHNAPHRAKREIVSFTTSNDYTMEVLVAVDSKMKEFHGESLKNYVLILMSIVSSIYLDPTIGNAIKVAVVHILLIHDDVNVKEIQAGTVFVFVWCWSRCQLSWGFMFMLILFLFWFFYMHMKECLRPCCLADFVTLFNSNICHIMIRLCCWHGK